MALIGTSPHNLATSLTQPEDKASFAKPFHTKPLRQSPTFAGVSWAPNTKGTETAHIWKVGGAEKDTAYHVEVKHGDTTQQAKLTRQKQYWQLNNPDQLGDITSNDTFYYRFIDNNGKPQLDFTERTEIDGQTWNVARKPTGATQSGSLLYAYPDSHLTSEQIKAQHHGHDALATHPPLDSTTRVGGSLDGVIELLNKLNTTNMPAVGGVMLTPHTGDWASSHRYQTADPFVLNDTFANFDTLVETSIQKGVKVYADGAFVNAGFESPLYQSLLLHGARSPYWQWFVFGTEQHQPETGLMPDVAANSKLVLGTLPVKENDYGGWELNWPHVGIRIENSPHQENYNPGQPTYLVQFDPLENSESTEKQWQPAEFAVQTYRWPVDPNTLTKRLTHSGLDKTTTQVSGQKAAALFEWPNFRLGRPDEDNSGYKWDGKVPAIKLDLTNPATQQYVQQALTYWTQRTRSLALSHIAQGLADTVNNSQTDTNSPANWDKVVNKLYDAGNILPKSSKVLTLHQPEQLPDGERPSNEQLVAALWRNAPLLSAQLPREALGLKAVFALPDFNDNILNHAGKTQGLHTLKQIIGVNKASNNSINAILGEQLGKLVDNLPPEMQKALATNGGLDILMDAIGPQILNLLLTNQQSNDPNTVAKGLLDVFGQETLLADPELASSNVRKQLARQAANLPILNLKPETEKLLDGITAESIDVAEQLLQHHEIGLNWRLDAAKDVANVDAVRDQPTNEAKQQRFIAEMDKAKQIWQQLLTKAKNTFPAMAVIAELTEIGPLSNNNSRPVFDKFLAGNSNTTGGIFSGITNMDYFYSALLRLIHYDPKPNEFGKRQMQVQAEGDPGHVGYHSFWDSVLSKFVTQFPKSATMFSQTLTASHDYANTLYNLSRNAVINDWDNNRYTTSVSGDVSTVLNAMAHRADFQPFRQMLCDSEVDEPEKAIKQLINIIKGIKADEVDGLLAHTLTSSTKKALATTLQETYNSKPPVNTQQTRQQLMELALDKAINSNSIDKNLKRALTKSHHAKELRQTLINAVTTASETWALRALMTNAFEGLVDAPYKPDANKFYTALSDVQAHYSQTDNRLPGYLSLTKWVDELGNKLWPNGSGEQDRKAFKKALYQAAVQPALLKDQRRLALMVALPGQPTWYDLFRTGGEQLNNRYLQNRELVRLDWLDNNDMSFIQQAMATNRAILALRQQVPVLNHGELQNIRQGMDNGVLIAAWDGGPDLGQQDGIAGQQAIMMVSTGKPRYIADNEYNAPLGTGKDATYPEITSEQLAIEKYEPYIGQLNQPVGTRYKDLNSGDEYELDDTGYLRLTNGDGTLTTWRCLIRQ